MLQCGRTVSQLLFIFNNLIIFRFQIELALQQLLNDAAPTDFDELLFWGRVSGKASDYYIALGVCFSERYEFPEKKFYWCSSANGMTFESFPALNDQHRAIIDTFSSGLFLGVPNHIHRKVTKEVDPEDAEAAKSIKAPVERDPLASTEEEDPESKVVKLDLKEIDRLHYHVRAIENDCHIVPQGSMRLNEKHEVQRNEAFGGLDAKECFKLQYYSHFRNV